MGLEMVEYIMEVEEEFRIKIPDDVSWELRTIGEMADYVVSQGGWTRGRVVQLLREIASNQSGLPLEQLRENSRFVEDLGFD